MQDNNWLCLAWTYQGEMYRRQRKFKEAFSALENAPHGLDVDNYVRGNRVQLLGRFYGRLGQIKKARETMSLAEELAFKETERTSSIYICFNPCSVYEEYARLCMHAFPEKSLQYIRLARKYTPSASRWRIPLLLTEGEILMRSVGRAEVREPRRILNHSNYEAGKNLVLEAVKLAKDFGHERQLWHANNLPTRLLKEQHKWGIIAQDLEESLNQSNALDAGDDY